MVVKLVVVRGQPQGKSLVFPLGEFVIGRGDECHIRPNSSWVSRQHCILRVTPSRVHLRDLGSANGTLVNGTRLIRERVLANGDLVQIGPLVFQIVLEEPIPKAKSQAETGAHCLETTESAPVSESRSGPFRPTGPLGRRLHAFPFPPR